MLWSTLFARSKAWRHGLLAAAARGQAAVIVSHPRAVGVAAGLARGGIFVLALGAIRTIAVERGP